MRGRAGCQVRGPGRHKDIILSSLGFLPRSVTYVPEHVLPMWPVYKVTHVSGSQRGESVIGSQSGQRGLPT
jgi:hypothetical protein